MSKDYSFSFSQAVTTPTGPNPDPESDTDRFAIADLSEHHLGDGAMLARNPRNGRRMVLAAEVLNALSHCNTFRTLDEHVAGLMEGGEPSAERARAIRSILQSVRDGGLTLSATELCRAFAPRPAEQAPAPPVAAIITCDRPQALQRLLDSILVACDTGGMRRLWVVDDSRQPASRERNRALVEAFAARAACPAHWFGPDQAMRWTSALQARLPDLQGPLSFLLDRGRWVDYVSTGVSRNLAQLLAVGQPLVVFDDDAVCRLYHPPYLGAGVEFSTGRRHAQFFEQVEAQDAERLRDDEDAVCRLNRCLGLSVPKALAALGVDRLEPSAWRHADARLAGALAPDARVRVTECGTIGNPGTPDYSWLATLPPASMRRLAGDPEQATLALAGARCWLGVDRPTFSPNANFSQITGFDNRDFLPPYLPFGRGQDRVFGETVRFLFPGDVTLLHPWAALHLRIDQAPAANRPQGGVCPDGFPGYLSFLPLERGAAYHARSPRNRLGSLAAAMTDLGHAPADALFRLYTEHRLHESAEVLSGLRGGIEACAGGDPAWLQWLGERQREYRAALDRERPAPSEDDASLGFWRQAWIEFGEALRAWPAIREAAAELSESAPAPQ